MNSGKIAGIKRIKQSSEIRFAALGNICASICADAHRMPANNTLKANLGRPFTPLRMGTVPTRCVEALAAGKGGPKQPNCQFYPNQGQYQQKDSYQ